MSKLALPIAALAFCTWAVYLGGLAALQHEACDTKDPTIFYTNPSLSCSKVYRFNWFVFSWEFVIVVLTAWAAVSNKLNGMRLSLVGLWSIATLLYIIVGNQALDALSEPQFESGKNEHRLRALTAGAIMTAAVNAVAVLLLGWTDCDMHGHAASTNTATTTKEVAPPV